MICRMCLLESTEVLHIFDAEAIQLNVAETVNKHFWFDIKSDDNISDVICNSCWWKIESFHVYYLSVEEAQRKLLDAKLPNNVVLKVEIENDPMDVADHGVSLVASKTDSVKDEDSDDGSDDVDFAGSNAASSNDEELLVIRDTKTTDQETVGMLTRGAKRAVSHQSIKVEETDILPTNESNVRGEIVLPKKRGRKKKSETVVPLPHVESEYRKKSKQLDEEIAQKTKLKCDLCISEFTIFSQLQRHYRTDHRKKGYVVCCTKKFFKRGLFLDHITKHVNPERFKCNKCNKIYANRRALQNHMYIHESIDSKNFQCEQCPRRFAKQYLLNHHKIIHTPKDQCKLFCEECGKGFNTNNSLQTHRRYIHENAYAQMCHICAKVIRGKSLFAKHQLEHAGITEPKEQCQECGVWLKNAFRLKLHMKKHSETENEHICNICGKASASSVGLQSHIRYVHAAKRQHQCPFCDKAFKKALTLKEHITTHTGGVLYTCPHCPKTFNSRSNMHSHRKKVHRQEWEEARKTRGMPPELLNRLIDHANEVPCNNSLENTINNLEVAPEGDAVCESVVSLA